MLCSYDKIQKQTSVLFVTLNINTKAYTADKIFTESHYLLIYHIQINNTVINISQIFVHTS